jgi:hypothetical protein
MYKYTITFLALNDTISFDINSPNREDVEEFVKELLFIFARVDEENEKIVVESFQQNNPDTITKITAFVDKFKSKMPPINAVSAFFRKLKTDEHFYFLPNLKLETNDNLKLYDHLRAIDEGKDVEEIQRQTSDLFGDLLTKYTIAAFGHKRVYIGERDKTKRVCRFCNNERKPTEYESEAHAISEALGNKTVILYEECDKCNNHFSRTIEPDIIQYLSLFRTFFDVKGKGGSKKFKGVNFELKNEENVMLSFHSIEDRPEEFSMPYKVKLEGKEPLAVQNIYKSLCKYFLSVIDPSQLSNFTETIKWINGEKEVERLPLVGEMISYHSFSKQPKLVTYIRKTDDKSIPFAVGEFHFTCKIFVFIVPFASNDKDFLDKTDFDHYWETFQHFKKSKGWAFMDYSNNVKKKFILNLSFNKDDKSDTTE